MKRVFLFVLDSFGIGAAPDAAEFGDSGANTLASISKSALFCLPNLQKLGLFNIDGVSVGSPAPRPTAAYGRLSERSAGKDTTSGHWELAGLVSKSPMPTYPDGFPAPLIKELEQKTGRKIICNKSGSGTKIIEKYGKEHLETGALIVYTSADSVLQIAAHTDIVPLEKLYDYCKIARGLTDVGRVIARPFNGVIGGFVRTPDRRDFSVLPPADTLLDSICKSGRKVISVGKISDIFAGRGVTRAVPSHTNAEGMKAAAELAKESFDGLCFINLVDFDMLYGHRRDVDGYARAAAEFDAFLPSFIPHMGQNDLLIITADHGCDPAFRGSDHTREYIPVLIYGANPRSLGTRAGFGNVGKTAADFLGVSFDCGEKGYIKELFI